MVLSPEEESLVAIVRALPPQEAAKVLNWARQLADLGGSESVDWNDSWTEQDLLDATAAAAKRFDAEEQEER